MSPLRSLNAALSLGFAMVFASSAAAQSLWLPRDRDHTVSLEMLHPSLEGFDSDLLSGAFFLAGRVAVSPRIAVVGELPYAKLKGVGYGTDIYGNEIFEDFSSSTIGNPYLGIETTIASGPVFIEFGGRPPLASEVDIEAELTGAFADVTRWDAFLPNVASIQAAFNVREVTPSRVEYRLRLSPLLEIPTEGFGEDELYALYSFLIGYHGATVRVGAGMSGRALLTEDYGNLGQRSVNQLELHSDFLSGSIRPALDLRLPLGTLSNSVPLVLGGSLSFTW